MIAFWFFAGQLVKRHATRALAGVRDFQLSGIKQLLKRTLRLARKALFGQEIFCVLGAKQIREEKAWNCWQSRLISEVC